MEREVCVHDHSVEEFVISEQGLAVLAEVDKHINKLDKLSQRLNPVSNLLMLNTLLDKVRGLTMVFFIWKSATSSLLDRSAIFFC